MSARARIAATAACVAGGAMLLAQRVRASLPPPSGPLPVGTTASSDRTVRIWYPAQRAGCGPYAPGERGRVTPYRALLRSHAALGVPLAAAAHPLCVLVYVPGWGGRSYENTALAEELASQGYVVAACDDRDATVALGFSSDESYADSLRRANEKVVRAARSAASVLHVLATDARFAEVVDLGRSGILGYSFGGAVAAQATRVDSRFRAAANIDGWLWGGQADAALGVPYLYMSASENARDLRIPAERRAAALDRADEARQRACAVRAGGYLAALARTRHASFTDANLYSLRPRERELLAPKVVHRLVADLVRAFFDVTLRGLDSSLLRDGVDGVTLNRIAPGAGRNFA
ncbi:MAG: dienelactone hydrolase family protein [Vulcanimicrobiaceae bacterium]